MKSRALFAVLTTAVLVVSSAVFGASSAVAAAGTTGIVINGPQGELVSGGFPTVMTPTRAQFAVSGTASSFQVTATLGTYVVSAAFRAAIGQSFVVGTTYDTFGPFNGGNVNVPGFTITRDGVNCDATGSFTITELNTDAGTGAITNLGATFQQTCPASAPYVASGAVYYNATTVTPFPASVTLVAPANGYVGSTHQLTGTLLADGVYLPQEPIEISRTDSAGTTTLHGVTDADGNFSVNDAPSHVGWVTYVVALPNPLFNAAPVTAKTYVLKATPKVKLVASASKIKYGSKVQLTASIGAKTKNHYLTIIATPANTGTVHPVVIAKGNVNSHGVLTATFVMSVNTSFGVWFTGDTNFAPQGANVDVTVSPKVTLKLKGYHHVNGRSFIFVNREPTFVYSALPHSSQVCVQIRTQVELSGVWTDDTIIGCARTNAAGNGTYASTYVREKGLPYRVRSVVAASNFTGGGQSVWVYFKIQ
jgi:hypothetical protein